MVAAPTTRVGIYRWSASGDLFTRTQMDTSHEVIDELMAIYLQGIASARPSAGTVGRFYYATDTGLTTYDDGVTWRDITSTSTVTLTGMQTLTNKTLTAPVITGVIALPSTTSIGNVSDTEISYLDGVTSAIQTQINTKAPSASPTFTGTVVLPSATSIGTVTNTEIGYLSGLTSGIQGQINGKANTSHTHGIADVTNLQTALDARGLTASGLNQFASTTSAQLAGVISDETGSGALVFGTQPTLSQPIIDNLRIGYATTATSNGTTTLVATSAHYQFFTGSSSHTVRLPDVSTLALGESYTIRNLSSGTLTVQSSGQNSIGTLGTGKSMRVTCISLSGTGASSWDSELLGAAGGTGSGDIVYANSPSLTGTPLSTTAAANTNTTQIATTAFVVGQAADTNPLVNGTVTIGTSLRYARQDHVHPTDTTRAARVTSTTTNTLPRFADNAGAMKTSGVTVDDSNNISGLGNVNGTFIVSTSNVTGAASRYFVETSTDGVIRPKTLANVQAEVVTSATVNAAIATSDVEITDYTKGIILKSQNATRYRITVENDGSLKSTAL